MKKKRTQSAISILLTKVTMTFGLLMLSCMVSHAQVKVVDEDGDTPISYASVFDDATGKVLGITNSDGSIPVTLNPEATISIQHLNYMPITVKVGNIQNDSIHMESRSYQVGEVAANSQAHDYLRAKLYVRQYSILNGKVAVVDESICYAYYDYSDHSKTPIQQILSRKILKDESALKGQKFWLQAYATESNPLNFTRLNIEGLNKGTEEIKYKELRQRAIKDGEKVATRILRYDPKDQRLEYILDSGYVEKPRRIPLLGLSMTNIKLLVNLKTYNKVVKLSGLENMLVSYRVVHNKTQGYVDSYTEMYVLGFDYASKEDLKETKKDAKENKKVAKAKKKAGEGTPFERPVNANIPPFNKYVETAMKTMVESDN